MVLMISVYGEESTGTKLTVKVTNLNDGKLPHPQMQEESVFFIWQGPSFSVSPQKISRMSEFEIPFLRYPLDY